MYIRASNDKFVTAELGGGINGFDRSDALVATRDEAKEWETFTAEKFPDGSFALRTSGGFYVTAEDGGGGPISTTRTKVGAWERFMNVGRLVICPDSLHILRVTGERTLDARGDVTSYFFAFEDTEGSRPAADPKALRTAFCIPTRPRVWWPAYLSADDAEQERFISETVRRNYNMAEILVSGLPYRSDYPEIQPDARLLEAGLTKLKDHGLTTMVAFDDRRSDDLSYLEPILAPSRGLIDWCMDIYEINGVLRDPEKVLRSLRQARQLLPDCLLAVHFTPLDAGEESYGLVDFRKAQEQANLNALLFQTAGWRVGPQDSTNRIHDFTRRLMGGFHGYPILSHGVYDFENTTSKTYRNEWTEDQAVKFTDYVMNAPLPPDEGFNAIRPTGFCDGGTV